MSAVEMRVQPGALSETMAQMRIWLDERGFEPSVFSCSEVDAGVLVRVDFKIPSEAAAFADRFSGCLAS